MRDLFDFTFCESENFIIYSAANTLIAAQSRYQIFASYRVFLFYFWQNRKNLFKVLFI